MLNLIGFTPQSVVGNVYRASRDGFGTSNFHSKSDNILGTLTIVKTTNGSVFGGFTTSNLNVGSSSVNDSNAFLFSLINQYNFSVKLNIKSTNTLSAITNSAYYGPCFSLDFCIADNSNQGKLSYSVLGTSYQLPFIYTLGYSAPPTFLAGSTFFQTSEIEVYSINCK